MGRSKKKRREIKDSRPSKKAELSFGLSREFDDTIIKEAG